MLGTTLIALLAACGSDYEGIAPEKVVDEVSATQMKATIDYLADDAAEGRILNSAGHDQARDYILGAFEDMGLQPLGVDGTYIHTYAHEARDGHFQPTDDGGAEPSQPGTGENLVAVLPGTDPALADQYIVLVAHYDHLGVNSDGSDVFNGAFDDAGGVAAVLEITRAIVEKGEGLRRSLLLLISDGEEQSLQGSEGWVDTPTTSLDDLFAVISVDPVGRPYLPDYAPLVLMGAERAPELRDLLRDTAPHYASAADAAQKRSVRFLARDMIEGFASDQDSFLDADIPAVWFTSPGMSFYHTVDDEADTIDYRSLREQVRWIGQVVYALDARTERFETVPTPEWDAFTLQEFDTFWGEVAASTHLDSGERDRIAGIREDASTAVASGDPSDLTNPGQLKIGSLLLMFSITRSHPGPIPPPFPDDE